MSESESKFSENHGHRKMLNGNLFQGLAELEGTSEHFEELVSQPGLRIERIVSFGQATPAGEWYDQNHSEWVVLLTGSAQLSIEGETTPITLNNGDWLELPAHCRHRVEWTQPHPPTIWLAIHYTDS